MLLEINGRPLFAIPGTFPFYRDLQAGMTGPDVMQLQVALKAAGYSVTADGALGGGTIGALQKMYAAAGYSPATTAAAVPQQDPPTEQTGAAGASTTTGPAAPTLVFPRSELLVLSATPAYIVDVPLVGTNVAASTSLTVEHGDVVASADLDNSVAARLKVGMSVSLDAGQGGRIQAVIRSMAPTAPTSAPSSDAQGAPASRGSSESSSASSGQTHVQISAAGPAPVPTQLLRQQVLATISVHLAAADALIVPTIAVVPAGNGNPHIFKRQPDGSFRSIEVQEIATLNGKSAVTPTQSDQLSVGDLVKVG
ncbi:hypothetical protein [Leifsonia sp. P73]|uniref:hypothetical protein n=1 Tax=Leifsonia sp. P73 TaxID=3423959 RepID=UPI003DA25489